MKCLLCAGVKTDRFSRRSRSTTEEKIYFMCATCGLIFLDPAFHLAPAQEKARYDSHQNDPSDPRYRTFLRQVTEPLCALLSAPSRGLDFGSGPGPAIGELMAENGHTVENYDPFYAPDASALGQRYDFITCTETAEHFYRPAREFSLIDKLLSGHGILALMTNLFDPRKLDFARWWYADDPTHVCFYSLQTMVWLSEAFAWQMRPQAQNVVFFKKGGAFV